MRQPSGSLASDFGVCGVCRPRVRCCSELFAGPLASDFGKWLSDVGHLWSREGVRFVEKRIGPAGGSRGVRGRFGAHRLSAALRVFTAARRSGGWFGERLLTAALGGVDAARVSGGCCFGCVLSAALWSSGVARGSVARIVERLLVKIGICLFEVFLVVGILTTGVVVAI